MVQVFHIFRSSVATLFGIFFYKYWYFLYFRSVPILENLELSGNFTLVRKNFEQSWNFVSIVRGTKLYCMQALNSLFSCWIRFLNMFRKYIAYIKLNVNML